jgi:hypothetical protein
MNWTKFSEWEPHRICYNPMLGTAAAMSRTDGYYVVLEIRLRIRTITVFRTKILAWRNVSEVGNVSILRWKRWKSTYPMCVRKRLCPATEPKSSLIRPISKRFNFCFVCRTASRVQWCNEFVQSNGICLHRESGAGRRQGQMATWLMDICCSAPSSA